MVRELIANWPVTPAKGNISSGLEESTHRSFVAARSRHLVVFNTDTGKELQALPIGQGVDDLAFDPASQRIVVSAVPFRYSPERFQLGRENDSTCRAAEHFSISVADSSTPEGHSSVNSI